MEESISDERSNISMDDDGENTDDEFPSDEEMHDQFKETEKDVPTENKYDN